MPATTIENPLEIVDISEISKDTADKLLHAASTQGFLLLEGHGFSQKEVNSLFSLSKDYFELPYSEKNKHPIDESNRGYTGVGVENLEEDELDTKETGDPKEGFNFANLDLVTGKAGHDDGLPEIFAQEKNEKLVESTIVKLTQVLHRVLELLAQGLEIDENQGGSTWFTSRHDPGHVSGSAFRFLHYPNPTTPEMTAEEKAKIGTINVAGAHTDYGTVTLLFQRKDEDGLEIFSPVSKKWTSVPYVPASSKFEQQGQAPPLVVNIADQLCYWTNGLLKSTIHRVRFPSKLIETGKDRYSIVFFAHPGDATLLEPVPAERIKSIKGRGADQYLAKHGKSMSAREHLDKRLASTYGWGKY